jgi:hypothetical protein
MVIRRANPHIEPACSFIVIPLIANSAGTLAMHDRNFHVNSPLSTTYSESCRNHPCYPHRSRIAPRPRLQPMNCHRQPIRVRRCCHRRDGRDWRMCWLRGRVRIQPMHTRKEGFVSCSLLLVGLVSTRLTCGPS